MRTVIRAAAVVLRRRKAWVGGESAAGAVLVPEYAQATERGRVVGAVQSAWSIGYAGVLIAEHARLQPDAA